MRAMTSRRTEESLALPTGRDAILLVVALTGVSSAGPLIAATAAPALAISFWRNLIGAGFCGVLAATRRWSELRALTRRGVLTATAAGAFLALHFGTWVPSVTMTTVASSTALVATQPVFAAVIARARGRFLPARTWAGIVLAIFATAFITGLDVTVSVRAVAGDLLAVAGAVFGALYVTVGATARVRMSATVYTGLCFGVCAGLLLVACALGRQPLVGFSGNAWIKIVAIAVVGQLLGHTLLNVILRSTSPTVLSLALLFEGPGAAIIAYVFLGQHPPASFWAGVALLLTGLALVVSGRGPDAAAVEAVS